MGLDLEDWVGSDSLEMGADGHREFWASGVICSGVGQPRSCSRNSKWTSEDIRGARTDSPHFTRRGREMGWGPYWALTPLWGRGQLSGRLPTEARGGKPSRKAPAGAM